MFIKTFAFVTAILFLLTSTIPAQDSCPRHVETGGGFSICVPIGWKVEAREGQKFKLVFAPRGERFTPNLNFRDDNDSRLLDDYATAGIDYLLEHYKDVGADTVKLLKREPITTAAGVSGVKVTLRSEFKGLLVRSLQYYFDGKDDQKVIMTATALEADQVTLDPIFDQAAKSFRVEK
jgi:hypothetical protein